VPVYVVPDLTTNFTVNVPANSLVYVQSTDQFYNVLVAVGRTVNMTYVLSDGSYYDDASVTSLGGYDYTYFVDTATNQSIRGTKTFNGNLLYKLQQLTQPNINTLQTNNSFKITDSLFIGSNQHIMQTTTNKLKTEGSLGITDTLGIGSTQWIRQSSINRLTSEGSIAATDTLLGAQANITTKITLGSQELTQGTVNRLDVENSLLVTDTLFAEVAEVTGMITSYDALDLSATWMLDNVAGSGYIGQMYYGKKVTWDNFAVIDTVGRDYKIRLENLSDVSLQNKAGSGQVEIIERDSTGTEVLANLNNIKSLDIQSQTLTQKNTNGVTWNNSITATDTLFGTNVNTSTITVSGLPSHTIAAGQVTPVVLYDTIGFAVSGLTTNSIVVVSYAEPIPTADTIACVYSVKAGWLTLMGENGKKINYWIPKK